jgi:hypothetical protein
MKRIWALVGIVLICGCKSTSSVVSSGASDYSSYEENLSNSLPEFPDYKEVKANIDSKASEISIQSVDGQLQRVQREVYDRNRADLYFNGFTVLVYSGIDRDRAFKTQQDLLQYFPDIQAEMQYQQPRYLVKIGRYSYRFEAQKVFSQIKGVFPSARIIPDRFQRKEYVSPITSDPNAERQN